MENFKIHTCLIKIFEAKKKPQQMLNQQSLKRDAINKSFLFVCLWLLLICIGKERKKNSSYSVSNHNLGNKRNIFDSKKRFQTPQKIF